MRVRISSQPQVRPRGLALALMLAAASLLSGCGTPPGLNGAVSNRAQNAAFPTLLPFHVILNEPRPAEPNQLLITNLEGRVAGLKARAARLRRQEVIDPATRAAFRGALAKRR